MDLVGKTVRMFKNTNKPMLGRIIGYHKFNKLKKDQNKVALLIKFMNGASTLAYKNQVEILK